MGSLGGGSKSSSKPLTPGQVQGYYTQLNANSGGRLADFARTGTQPTAYTPLSDAGRVTAPRATAQQAGYQPLDVGSRLTVPTLGAAERVSIDALTPERVTALGGLGALREQAARRQSAQSLAQVAADPGLSTFQRLRANQLEAQDLGGTLDALAAEREAAITGLLTEQQGRQLQAALANQGAGNQFSLAGAQLGMDYQQLLGSLTGDEQGRQLQAALANQAAANQTSQFNAQQTAAADALNVQTALEEARRQYAAQVANASLSRDDMEALARIYFGGSGQVVNESQKQGALSGITLAV